VAAAVTVPLAVYLQNWSVVEPRSYFALHRAEFDAVARRPAAARGRRPARPRLVVARLSAGHHVMENARSP
jgi:hypothetical protein